MRSPKLLRFASVVVVLTGSAAFIALAGLPAASSRALICIIQGITPWRWAWSLLLCIAFALIVGFTMSLCETFSESENLPELRHVDTL